MLMPYKIVAEFTDKSRIRVTEPVSTERGEVYKYYTGKIRIFKRLISRKTYAKEAYVIRTKKYNEWSYKSYIKTSKKIYWETIKE